MAAELVTGTPHAAPAELMLLASFLVGFVGRTLMTPPEVISTSPGPAPLATMLSGTMTLVRC